MLSLAGVYLPLPTDDIHDFIARNINPELYCPWLRRSWPGFGLAGITWPTGYRQDRPVRINRFRWPQGASRWAYSHFYCDARCADQIRNAAFGEDGEAEPSAIPLRMDSPGSKTAETLETNVFLLPPTPISGVPVEEDGKVNNAFLLTVVDLRYSWWFKQTPKLEFADETTWEDVFDTIRDALEIEIDIDEIAAEYLNASPTLNLSYEVIPPFFDAVAANVGQRVVIGFDGAVSTENYQTAVDVRQGDRGSHPDRVRVAGGERFRESII